MRQLTVMVTTKDGKTRVISVHGEHREELLLHMARQVVDLVKSGEMDQQVGTECLRAVGNAFTMAFAGECTQ